MILTINVHLEKAFVQNASSLGAGSVAMLMLVGPFSKNVVTLAGKVVPKEGNSATQTFLKRLDWGESVHMVTVPQNCEIQLALCVGGTRTGQMDIGTVSVENEPTRTIYIKFTGDGVEIITSLNFLAQNPSKKAIESILLLAEKTDEDTTLRIEALNILGKTADCDDLLRIKEIFFRLREGDPAVREAAANAIKEIETRTGTQRDMPWFLKPLIDRRKG
ncbi:MAG: hypothetical protein V2A65_07970 [Candidatus Omnitrophota bacterium]